MNQEDLEKMVVAHQGDILLLQERWKNMTEDVNALTKSSTDLLALAGDLLPEKKKAPETWKVTAAKWGCKTTGLLLLIAIVVHGPRWFPFIKGLFGWGG